MNSSNCLRVSGSTSGMSTSPVRASFMFWSNMRSKTTDLEIAFYVVILLAEAYLEAKITLWQGNLLSSHLRMMSECLESHRMFWKSSSMFCFAFSSAALPPRLVSLPGMVIVATRFNREVLPVVKNVEYPSPEFGKNSCRRTKLCLVGSPTLCHRSSFNPWCDVYMILFLKTSYVSLIYKRRIVLKIFTDPFLSYTLLQKGEISNIRKSSTKTALIIFDNDMNFP